MSITLEQLIAQVEVNTQVEQSAIILITEIAAQLEDLQDDPEQIQALADKLRGSAEALATAVAANTATPVETPPVEETPPAAPSA